MNYKTNGIILKRQNFGEADRIVTIMTEDLGKVRAIAKGVRKTLSKMAGHLEPFCLTRLELAEGRNLNVICGAEVKEPFLEIRNDLAKTSLSFYMAEIIDQMTEEAEPHKEIFYLLQSVLEHANDAQEPLLISYFELNFLEQMGFRPELFNCLKCNSEIEDAVNHFDYIHGGLVCGECGGANPVSARAIKVLRLFLKHDFATIKKIKVDEDLISEIQKITNRYLKHIHQQDFKSERFVV